MTELPFGQRLPDLDPGRLRLDASRSLLAACLRHPDFTVRELRVVSRDEGEAIEGIVVETDNRQVPCRNPYGIRAIEPLLLTYEPGARNPYDVRALRADFPILLHQNGVLEGEPVSLCLYEQPWHVTERSWTPARHLDRILWWLGQSAQGELHADDQGLEQLFYYNAPQLVLPANFDEAWIASHSPMLLGSIRTASTWTLRPMPPGRNDAQATVGLLVSLRPVGHPPLSRQPATLGALADYFAAQGSDLVAPLCDAVRQHWPESGAQLAPQQHALLVLRIPRQDGGVLLRIDTHAVLLEADVGTLGLKLGALDRAPGLGNVFRSYTGALSSSPPAQALAWRDLKVSIVPTVFAASREAARAYSGIEQVGEERPMVLAGAGSLGSALFNLWLRSGWGRWTLIDPDTVSPHNLVRHTAIDVDIGAAKVQVLTEEAQAVFPSETPPRWFQEHVGRASSTEVLAALSEASLIVDATATLAASRELSVMEGIPRVASAFLSPSGRSGILLLEDRGRDTRLLSLEAQYYRGVLNASWGTEHLAASGAIRPGATCRDVSLVLSVELMNLHASILAHQIRRSSANACARIAVWNYDEPSGSIQHVEMVPSPYRSTARGDWTIGWDVAVEDELRRLRRAALPNETGGVLLGIIDTALQIIQVVDVVPAPYDSAGDSSGFIRGTQGLLARVEEAQHTTQGAVGYVGDWHSHPPGHSTRPSITDLHQLVALAERLDAEGIPALVCIVGSESAPPSWSLGHFIESEA